MVNKGVAIVGVVIIGFLFIAFVLPGIDLTLDESLNLDVDIYNTANGQRITPPLAFIAGGSEVDALVIDASWEALGSGVDWTTLVISGDFQIDLLDYQGYVKHELATNTRLDFLYEGEAHKTGNLHFSLVLDNLLIGEPYSGGDANGYYWHVQVTWNIHGQVDQEIGGVPKLTDDLTDSVTFTYFWEDGTFGLAGGIQR